MKPCLTLMAALSVFVLISCILGGDKVAGRGSEVENEVGVYGLLVDEAGNPVKGARVKARPSADGLIKIGVSARAAADSDSVVTDAKGQYGFTKLGKGTYDLFGDFQSGSLVVLVPSVVHEDSLKRKNVGTDTLRAPGRIRGRLYLGDQGKSAVLCYVPGTSFLAVSDDSGRFVLSGLAQGRYTVGYSLPGYAIDQDTGVIVRSGETTELPPRQLAYDSALPPPAPVGLKAEYDSSARSVTLTWDSVPVSDLDGYVVYRDEPLSQDPKILPGGFVKVASFVDSVLPVPVPGNEELILTYRVKARDKEANLSVNFSAPIQVTVVTVKTGIPGWHKAGDLIGTGASFNPYARFAGFAGRIWALELEGMPSAAVWSSPNGTDWVESIPSLSGHPLTGAQIIAFKNRLWIIGHGFPEGDSAEIWSTADGKDWTKSKAPPAFKSRTYSACTVFKGELWLVGGSVGGGMVSDVWRSADGIHWIQATDSPGFGMQQGSLLGVMGDRMILVCALPPGTLVANGARIWASSDGIHWVEITQTPPPNAGNGQLVFLEGKLRMMYGSIWATSDGAAWEQEYLDFPYDGSTKGVMNSGAFLFNDALWVILQESGSPAEMWNWK